jgi:hypothetical protein
MSLCGNIEQAGINTITLLENRDIDKVFDISTNELVLIQTLTGQTIEIENKDEIQLTETLQRNKNNRLHYKYNLSYDLYGLTETNNQLIQDIISSIYGWLMIIDYYNGEQKAIIEPVRFGQSDINNNVSAHYNINITNSILIPAEKKVKYIPSVWILATNFWNDNGIWIDSETWND